VNSGESSSDLCCRFAPLSHVKSPNANGSVISDWDGAAAGRVGGANAGGGGDAPGSAAGGGGVGAVAVESAGGGDGDGAAPSRAQVLLVQMPLPRRASC
jgi:hypothetical protein